VLGVLALRGYEGAGVEAEQDPARRIAHYARMGHTAAQDREQRRM
jgi:hypothetical protein